VRDAVAGLGVGLVRMEQRRHRIAELFIDDTTTPADDHAHATEGDGRDAA
jgi:ABC-2 type transport system ATP-binding protein